MSIQRARLNPIDNKKNVQKWSMGLAIVTTLAYVFLGGLSANAEHPVWYRVLTSCVLLNIALLASAILCLRNGLSSIVPTGRKTWLLLGCALLSFLGGSIFFSSWELAWGLNPAGSLGDPFFLMFYIFLPVAMFVTIVRKKVSLKAYQWFFLSATAAFSSLLVFTITILLPSSAVAEIPAPAPVVQTVSQSNASDTPAAPAIPPTTASETSAPDWVMAIDSALTHIPLVEGAVKELK
jgi:hypothetical protein